MKIICTTSNSYKHIVPIFIHLFNKYWGDPIEIVGYEHPGCELPANFTFHSMGVQSGNKQDFSNDLRKYFEKQDQYFIWLMEDTFIKEVDFEKLGKCKVLFHSKMNIGRISLSSDSLKHYTSKPIYDTLLLGVGNHCTIHSTPPDSDYRLSTQPAIWNRDYLLKWLRPDHSPWEFENLKGTLMQTPDNEFLNLALEPPVLRHNEGVRKRDLYAYDLNGIDESVINEMKEKNIMKIHVGCGKRIFRVGIMLTVQTSHTSTQKIFS